MREPGEDDIVTGLYDETQASESHYFAIRIWGMLPQGTYGRHLSLQPLTTVAGASEWLGLGEKLDEP